jgi:hypothetical protein
MIVSCRRFESDRRFVGDRTAVGCRSVTVLSRKEPEMELAVSFESVDGLSCLVPLPCSFRGPILSVAC